MSLRLFVFVCTTERRSTAAIIPVPKNPSNHITQRLPASCTDSRSDEVFERLGKEYITSRLSPTLGPFQVAYRSKRSTEGPSPLLLTSASHIWRRRTTMFLLFQDYSSAFNHSTTPGRQTGTPGLNSPPRATGC